jgi:hypothetical protein
MYFHCQRLLSHLYHYFLHVVQFDVCLCLYLDSLTHRLHFVRFVVCLCLYLDSLTHRLHFVQFVYHYCLHFVQFDVCLCLSWGRRGSDRMIVGFTTTYAISAYHH